MKKQVISVLIVLISVSFTSCINVNITNSPTEDSLDKLNESVQEETLEKIDSNNIEGNYIEEDNAIYSSVTSAEKDKVESFAKKIREAYIKDDFKVLADSIKYPIYFDSDMKDFSMRGKGKKINNENEFMSAVKGMHFSADSKKLMEEETCENMWAQPSSGGISFGSGLAWIEDVNFDGVEMKTNGEARLKIFSLLGLE